jgi:hypothetical protein
VDGFHGAFWFGVVVGSATETGWAGHDDCWYLIDRCWMLLSCCERAWFASRDSGGGGGGGGCLEGRGVRTCLCARAAAGNGKTSGRCDGSGPASDRLQLQPPPSQLNHFRITLREVEQCTTDA